MTCFATDGVRIRP